MLAAGTVIAASSPPKAFAAASGSGIRPVQAVGAPASPPASPPDSGRKAASAASSCDPDDLPGGSEGPDNDGDECGFTISGKIDTPTPTPQDLNSEFAEGSPQLAATCNPRTFAEDEVLGRGAAAGFLEAGAPTAAVFLSLFLNGNTSPEDLPDGSPLAFEVKLSSLFRDADKQFQQYAKQLLDQGQLSVDITGGLHLIDFSKSIIPDLALAFGGTQGLQVSGSGYEQNGRYVGSITYKIQDIYGFYPTYKFLGMGPRMHYLQSVCGAPYYPGGAHWYPDSVTVTVPFDQPIG